MLDTNLMNSSLSVATLLDRVRAGSDVLLTAAGDAGRDLLDDAALALSGECRTVRVSAREPGLSLSGLMAQVAGAADPEAQDDAVLERGYQILAVPDAPGGRIVWLIDGADLLQRPALRYVQHMVRSARALTLVMAGGPAFAAVLDGDDFAGLRDRLLPAAPARVPEPLRAGLSLVPVPASAMLETRRVAPFLLMAGVGIAACVALGVWIGGSKWDPSPAATAEVAHSIPQLAANASVAPAAPPALKPDPAPVGPASVAVAPAVSPAPAAAPVTAEIAPPARTPVTAAVEPRHERVHVAEAPAGETGHVRRARHPETRDVATGPRRIQPAGLAESPPPSYGRAWDQQPPDWTLAARPTQTWQQPRAYPGYAGGYEPQNSYIGTFSTDRNGYRTFRYEP